MSIKLVSLQPNDSSRKLNDVQEEYICNALEYRGITDVKLHYAASPQCSRVNIYNTEQEFKDRKESLMIFSWWRPEYKCYGDVV